MRLSIKQTESLDILEYDITTELLFGGGAGGGKSLLGCYWILKNCFKYPETRWLIGRAKYKTLRDTTLKTLFEVIKMQGIPQDQWKLNGQTGSIQIFSTGSEIVFKDLYHYPSDPHFDSLGSLEITGAFVDEASEITQKAFTVLNSRMRYKLDQHNIIPKTLLTCNPSKNWLYTEFYKPEQENRLPEHRKFLKSLVTDNPNISKHYITQLGKLDRTSKERLLFGNWEYEDTKGKLMEYDSIIDMFSNKFVDEGKRYLSIDVARFGSDSSVVCLWNGLRCEAIYQYKQIAINELAKNVTEITQQHKIPRIHIICDEDGDGGGVVVLLGCKGFLNNGRVIGGENYANLKTQCYYKLAELVNDNKIYIQTSNVEMREKIIQELEVVQVGKIDNESKLNLIKKDKIRALIGRSPDVADALMMRMFFELSYGRIRAFG